MNSFWQTKIGARLQPTYLKLMLKMRKTALPGFRGMGMYDVFKFFFLGLSEPRFSLAASAMAFNFFFSFFPTLLILVLVVSWLPDAGLDQYISEFLMEVLPSETFSMVDIEKIVDVKNVRRALKRSVDPNRGYSLFFIGLILFFALRGALRGIITMTRAFSKDDDAFRKRTIYQTYSTALIIFLVLGGLFLFSIIVLVFGKWLVLYLVKHQIISPGLDVFLINSLNYLISLSLLTLSVSTIYYLGPATHQRWKFFTPGSLVASILILITVVGFSWFFSNLDNFQTVYGSLAAIILLMLWFYYLSLVLLIGFELNAAIDLASLHLENKKAIRKVDKKDVMAMEIVVENNAKANDGMEGIITPEESPEQEVAGEEDSKDHPS